MKELAIVLKLRFQAWLNQPTVQALVERLEYGMFMVVAFVGAGLSIGAIAAWSHAGSFQALPFIQQLGLVSLGLVYVYAGVEWALGLVICYRDFKQGAPLDIFDAVERIPETFPKLKWMASYPSLFLQIFCLLAYAVLFVALVFCLMPLDWILKQSISLGKSLWVFPQRCRTLKATWDETNQALLEEHGYTPKLEKQKLTKSLPETSQPSTPKRL